MPYVCPKCRKNDLRVHAVVAIRWDGVADEVDEAELPERIASDAIIWPEADVSCNNEECEWSGTVEDLIPREEQP